jgi:Nitroreductase
MNDVIKLLNNHRSLRKFTDEKLSEETIRTLVGAAQSASTSSYVQAYSIMGVTDPEKKKALREISTQSYVEHNGHLFVFVVDFYRHKELAKQAGKEISYDKTENLIVGVVDASLAAQNLATAAESMGLGICYIGSLRNDIKKAGEILGLPEGAFVLFGMVAGYPEQEKTVRKKNVCHLKQFIMKTRTRKSTKFKMISMPTTSASAIITAAEQTANAMISGASR